MNFSRTFLSAACAAGAIAAHGAVTLFDFETSQEIADENMLVKVLKERKFTCFWGEEAAARLKE